MKIKLLFLFAFMGTLLISCGEESKGTKGEWSQSYKDDFIAECIDAAEPEAKEDVKKICPCLADKLEAEFAPGDENKDVNEDRVDAMMTSCAMDILGEVLGRELSEMAEDISESIDINNGDWEAAEKEEILQGCIAEHEEAGSTAEEAQSLCTCIVDKLEAELGVDEVKMETIDADLKTDEFTKACAADLGIEVKIELLQSGN